MVAFDQDRWETRVKKRFERTRGAAPVSQSYASEMRAVDDLRSLVEWCKGRCIDVEFTDLPKGDAPAVYLEQSDGTCNIKVSCRLLPEKQLFFLLHECGHTLIGTRRKNERYGMGYTAATKDPLVTKTLHHRFDVLDEEMEAWHRGMKLAKRLKLRLNKERYHLARLDSLRRYTAWVLKPGSMVS